MKFSVNRWISGGPTHSSQSNQLGRRLAQFCLKTFKKTVYVCFCVCFYTFFLKCNDTRCAINVWSHYLFCLCLIHQFPQKFIVAYIFSFFSYFSSPPLFLIGDHDLFTLDKTELTYISNCYFLLYSFFSFCACGQLGGNVIDWYNIGCVCLIFFFF